MKIKKSTKLVISCLPLLATFFIRQVVITNGLHDGIRYTQDGWRFEGNTTKQTTTLQENFDNQTSRPVAALHDEYTNLTIPGNQSNGQTFEHGNQQEQHHQDANARTESIIVDKKTKNDSATAPSLESINMPMPGNLSNSSIYFCGYEENVKRLYEHLYPELSDKIRNATLLNRDIALNNATENDILLNGSEGDCGWGKLKGNWLEHNFPGTVIIINGENWAFRSTWTNLSNPATIPRNQYHIGHIADGCQSRRIYFMAQELVRQRDLWDFFFFHGGGGEEGERKKKKMKPQSTKERFLVYSNSHCVDFREDAVDAIALAHPSQKVEYVGSCSGTKKNITNIVKSDLKFGPGKSRGKNLYLSNWKLMRKFRFCFVMENAYVEGYITEKILLAFAGGCIPIYYGTTEIFDIFNPKSFIYYDIHNPQVALTEITRLEENITAYQKVMAEPILLEGNDTIQKYFSLSDEIIPNAMLKERLRSMVYTRCKR